MEELTKIEVETSKMEDYTKFKGDKCILTHGHLDSIGDTLTLTSRDTIYSFDLEKVIELYPRFELNSVKIRIEHQEGLFVKALFTAKYSI